MAIRNLIPILGDQLSRSSTLLEIADPDRDVIVMGEVAAEIGLFLSAMRHFRNDLRGRGFHVDYQEFSAADAFDSFESLYRAKIEEYQPDNLVMTEPGRADIEETFRGLADEFGIDLEVFDDPHFLLTRSEFAQWAQGRKSLVAETFYRMMRRRTGYLMDGDNPIGGAWNFDKENRHSFKSESGPGATPPIRFEPDEITRRIQAEVDDAFPELPGSTSDFGWPVTPDQAREALADFVENRLPLFGTYQDAMWTGERWLYHSLLSAALNLRLIDPREVIEAALKAYDAGDAPLNAVEGFVRQIIGWREFIRGIYWLRHDELHSGNALDADQDLPPVLWSGETSMRCVSDTVEQLLETGYAHHIQRLMVAGLLCQLYGVEPGQVHDWFMVMYIDSVEWVTLPNTVGMSQYADGGIVGTKPYIASGKYIDRMSNHCGTCKFDPADATTEAACPFTTLYWDFIRRHESLLEANGRTVLQVRNYQRKSAGEKAAITRRANQVKELMSEGAL